VGGNGPFSQGNQSSRRSSNLWGQGKSIVGRRGAAEMPSLRKESCDSYQGHWRVRASRSFNLESVQAREK